MHPSSTHSCVLSVGDNRLSADEFLALFKDNWNHDLDRERVRTAIASTINITARHEGRLVGCVRLLTDGYLLATIPEVLIHPAFRKTSLGEELLALADQASPTHLLFAVQRLDEGLAKRLGWVPGLRSWVRRKDFTK